MSKRLVSLLVALAVLASCMVIPAYASDIEVTQTQMINVLELASPNDSGAYWLQTDASGRVEADFKLPYSTIVRYFDMVVSSTTDLAYVYLQFPGDSDSTRKFLNVEPIWGTTYFRVYGAHSGRFTDEFELTFLTNISSVAHIQFYSFHLSAQPEQAFFSPVSFSVGSSRVDFTSNSSPHTLSVTYETDLSGAFLEWESSVISTDWTRFDYLTLNLEYAVDLWTRLVAATGMWSYYLAAIVGLLLLRYLLVPIFGFQNISLGGSSDVASRHVTKQLRNAQNQKRRKNG